MCSKLLFGWHVDVINKQHHMLTHRRPISTPDKPRSGTDDLKQTNCLPIADFIIAPNYLQNHT